MARLDEQGIEGKIIGLDDPYGYRITDIPGDDFKKLNYALGDKVTVVIVTIRSPTRSPTKERLWTCRRDSRCSTSIREGEWPHGDQSRETSRKTHQIAPDRNDFHPPKVGVTGWLPRKRRKGVAGFAGPILPNPAGL